MFVATLRNQCYDKNNNDLKATDSENKNNDVDGNIDSRNVNDEEDIEIDNEVDVRLNSINTETENTNSNKAVITDKQNLFDDDVDSEEVLQSSSFSFGGYFNPSNKKRKDSDQTNADFDDSKPSYTQSELTETAAKMMIFLIKLKEKVYLDHSLFVNSRVFLAK